MGRVVTTRQLLQQKRDTLNAEYKQYLAHLINNDPQTQAYNSALQQLNLLMHELTPPPEPATVAEPVEASPAEVKQ